MRKMAVILVLLAGLVAGCEEKFAAPDPAAAGYAYYPLAVGDYRIYNVTNIRFRNNVSDTTRFQLREVVDTVFNDQTNTPNYKIVRSIRPDAESEWVEDSVMLVSRIENSLILTKDNTKYVKLIFPVKEGGKWLGDAYNDHVLNADEKNPYKRKEPYTYKNLEQPFTYNGKTYARSVTVVQGNPVKNLVQYDDRREVYVKDIGMVYRIFNRVVYCNDANTCEFGVDFKLNGHERHEELITYGKL